LGPRLERQVGRDQELRRTRACVPKETASGGCDRSETSQIGTAAMAHLDRGDRDGHSNHDSGGHQEHRSSP
jgi:hypothetical protein